MRRLYLHIGMHRAQSTSLQHALDFFSKLPGPPAYYYPESGRSVAFGGSGGHELLVDPSHNCIDKNVYNKLLEELQEFAEEIPVVLSSEEFWRLRPSAFLCFLENFEIFPVCIEREFFSWLISVWSLTTLLGQINATPVEFLEHVAVDLHRLKADSFYNSDDKISQWSFVFGERFSRFKYPLAIPHVDFLALFMPSIPDGWREVNLTLNKSAPISEILKETAKKKQTKMQENQVPQSHMERLFDHFECLFGKKIPNSIHDDMAKFLSIGRAI
jgi:hypothetical protein